MKLHFRNRFTILCSLIALTLIASIVVGTSPKTEAAAAADFNASRIMDDGVFFNPNSMPASSIQAFLNAKVPVCDTNGTQMHSSGQTRAQYGASVGNPAPYTCLKNYVQAVPGKSPDSYCSGGISAGTKSAAQIIFEVSQACGVNPQVLLVLLQKEQSLITDDWPWNIQYRSATGYGCPDTAACDSTYYGFFNQVYSAARQFQRYAKQSHLYNYRPNVTSHVQYNPNAGCGGTNLYMQNQTTAGLYNYTPYQPNAAAMNNLYGSGDSCSAYGNRNFWRMYTDWFGSSRGGFAFRSSTNPTIYLYIGGYKIIVSQMGILQDHGISPESIQVLSQAAVDGIPSPPAQSGLSNTLGYLVKSTSDQDDDGGTLYLMARGLKVPISSMEQFHSFGFSESQITYVPLGYLYSLPNGPALSNYIQAPNQSVFQVASATKRIIFEYDTYRALNPSDRLTPVSYFTANLITSGVPLSNREILVKNQSSEAVYLLINNNYYSIPTFDAYNCWGFTQSLGVPLYRVADDSYLSPINPSAAVSCVVNNGSKTYLMSKNYKYELPPAYGIPSPAVPDADIVNLANRLPSSSTPLKQFVKSNTDSAVWLMENGTRKIIPTYSNFLLLKVTSSQLDVIDGSSVSSLPAVSGIKLGNGQVVKTTDGSGVYIISGAERILYATSDDYLAYRNDWSDIESYSSSSLNQSYPYTSKQVSKYLYDQPSSKIYLVDPNGCFVLTSSLLTSYGQNQSTIAANQSYNADIFSKLSLGSCKVGSVFAKQPGQGTVYWVDGGTKRLISKWDTLVDKSGSNNPYVVTLSPSLLNTLSTGTPLD